MMGKQQQQEKNTNNECPSQFAVSAKKAFLLVSLSLGQLGDGLNIFQGIYLVGIGWNEGSVGLALSLMGLTSLVIQPWAGDWVDKTTVDRRFFLAVASLMTAASASSILLVNEDNQHHLLIYATKIVEGMTSSFLGPCLSALTLACFGPHHFDAVMASNIFWGHVGSVMAAVLAGLVSYILYPNIRFCFLVIGASALIACFFVQYLPQGDPLMGRGFAGKPSSAAVDHVDPYGKIEYENSSETSLLSLDTPDESYSEKSGGDDEQQQHQPDELSAVLSSSTMDSDENPTAASYWEVFMDVKSVILCLTGFFFHFANANVLLVLGEMMGQDKDGKDSKDAIPLVAGAIVTAQVTMSVATYVGDKLTVAGMGRKPLFLAALASLPVRCALIIYLKDAGNYALLSTQVLDGVGGGLLGLVQPYLVADITFGTGRFNVLTGVTASCFGLGATLSNYLGQMVVEKFDHETSLTASLMISFVPLLLFSLMPETHGMRGKSRTRSSTRTTDFDGSPSTGLYGSFDC